MNNTFATDAINDMVRCFVDTINGQVVSSLQPLDGVYVVDVIERLYKSIQSNGWNYELYRTRYWRHKC